MTGEQFLSLTFHRGAIRAFPFAAVNAGFVQVPSHSQQLLVAWATS